MVTIEKIVGWLEPLLIQSSLGGHFNVSEMIDGLLLTAGYDSTKGWPTRIVPQVILRKCVH